MTVHVSFAMNMNLDLIYSVIVFLLLNSGNQSVSSVARVGGHGRGGGGGSSARRRSGSK